MSSEDVEQLLGQIKLLNRRLRREQSAVEGLSTAALVVLAAATRADTTQRPGELAAELQMSSPNMTWDRRHQVLEIAGPMRPTLVRCSTAR